MRLMVAIPCYEHLTRHTATSLANLMFALGALPPAGFEWVALKWTSGSNLPESRHKLVTMALGADATHILWIDSDMEFPVTSLSRLLAHDRDIVGCNYPRRNRPHYSSASDEAMHAFDLGMAGLTKAGLIGFGLLLTRTSVFRHPFEMPLFANHDADGYVSDDVPFARKVRAAGFDIWCDHDLSREVKHIGVRAYEASDIEKMPIQHVPTRR